RIPVNASVPSYPNTAWGLRARWSFTDNVYAMTGVYDAFSRFRANRYHGVDFSIRHDSGVAVMQEFGWQPLIARRLGLPGTVKVGGVYTSEPKVKFESGNRRSGTYDVYATIQQKLWEEPGATHQGLSGFLAVTYAPADLNTIEHFVDGGLLYTGLVPRRDRDVLGLLGLYGDFRPDLTRHPLREHDADARDGCRATGGLGASRDAHGDGTGRVRALAAAAALRPGRPDLAEPRPLRALDGPRLDAALLAPPPDGGEGGEPRVRDARDAGRDARRHPPLPPARQQVSRAPRVPLDLRRRDHDGSAR